MARLGFPPVPASYSSPRWKETDLLREAIVWIGGSVLVSVICLILFNRIFPKSRRIKENELTGQCFGALGAFYTVLVAFVIVAVWGNLDSTEKNVSDEANALPGLYFSATVFPPDQRVPLQQSVVEYTNDVITEEWPSLAKGRPGQKTELAAKKVRKALLSLDPETPKQQALFSTMVERINTVNSSRRDRINAAHSSIPGFFWATMVIGGAILVGFALFFGSDQSWSHLLMVVVLSIVVSSSLLLVRIMDHPFRGTVSVKPDALNTALVQMGHPRPGSR
jgi:uncharacterized protein (DUF983 family)